MKKLVEGNKQFRSAAYETEKALFERLAGGQAPEVLFVTCSDSRIDPNLITHTKPGDLFVIRNAGNLCPPYGAGDYTSSGTIEYAAAALKVTDIVVCGHSACGAMTGLMNPDGLAGLDEVVNLLNHAKATRKVVQDRFGDLTGDALVNRAIEVNVMMQLANLKTHPSVAARVSSGDLKLHGWVYDIGTGNVRAFDPENKEFVDLDVAGTRTAVPAKELDIQPSATA